MWSGSGRWPTEKMVGVRHIKDKIKKLVPGPPQRQQENPSCGRTKEGAVEELLDIAAADAVEVLQKNRLLNPEDKKEDRPSCWTRGPSNSSTSARRTSPLPRKWHLEKQERRLSSSTKPKKW